MKKLKHLFTALLLLCYVGTATAHDFEVDGIYYNITDATNKTVEVTYKGSYYYNNEYTDCVVIPESVTYNGTTYSVTSIGSYAFYDCSELTSITIPNSVTSIGDRAFYDCYGLTSVTIPNSVTSIGSSAFSDCSGLTSITIPNSVTGIGSYAFSGCSGLTNITIPNRVTSIGYEAFKNCTGLTSIEIPNSVTSIGSSAFQYCYGLTSVTIPNSVTSIGNEAFSDCSGLTSITIPNSVTSIGNEAFSGCTGLTSIVVDGNNTKYDSREDCNAIIETETNTLVSGCKNTVIPSSVTSIGNYAFYKCTGLTSITIPNRVTSIGSYAFYYCTELTSIEIPNSVTSIGDRAFEDTVWYNNQPNGVVYAGKVLYKYKGTMPSNTSITIKDGTLSITSGAFAYCFGLTSVEIGNSVTSIEDYAFYYSGLTSITIPNSVTSIGGYTFSGCTGLTSVVIGNSVTSIEDYAFYNCSGLTSVTIGNSVTSIGYYAFYNCSELTSVTIGNSVTSIGYNAFFDCTGLKTVYNFSNLTFSKGSEDYGYIAHYADKVYNVPNGSVEGDFIFGKPNYVNTLLYYLGNATELTLPANYKGGNYTIGANVFKGNTTITSITIPNSVTSIGNYAFRDCTGLKSITIPNSITYIGYQAFQGCAGLTAVHIGDIAAWCGIDFGSAEANPLYYAKNLYLNGEQLTNLTIPAEVVEVKDYAFYNCKGVTNINIVDGVKSIGSNAFYGCSNLETLYISNTIESIDNNAFAECNNILEIKIGSKKAITASENIFSSDAYNNACLYVPTGRMFAYEKTAPWSNFYIVEMDFTGIEELKSENGKVKTIYDLNGRAVEKPTKGIYIIDGKKVIVK